MNKAEQELLDYLSSSSYRDYKLKQLIHAVWQSGMMDAAEICVQYKNHGDIHPPINTRNAILTAANKPVSNPNPHIVFHGKEPE